MNEHSKHLVSRMLAFVMLFTTVFSNVFITAANAAEASISFKLTDNETIYVSASALELKVESSNKNTNIPADKIDAATSSASIIVDYDISKLAPVKLSGADDVTAADNTDGGKKVTVTYKDPEDASLTKSLIFNVTTTYKDDSGETGDWKTYAIGNTFTNGEDYELAKISDDSFTLKTLQKTKGKISDKDDQYYAYAIPVSTNDNVMVSADISFSDFNALSSGSLTQISGGMVAFDKNGTTSAERKQNAVFASLISDSKGEKAKVYPRKTTDSTGDASTKPYIGDKQFGAGETYANATGLTGDISLASASDRIHVSIKKSSNYYTITAGDNSYTYSVDSNFFSGDDNTVYIGFYAARDIKLDVTNLKVEQVAVAKEVRVLNPVTEYIVNSEFNYEGMTVEALYEGSSEWVVVDPADYVIDGFDTATTGKKTVKIAIGAFAEYEINVDLLQISEIKVTEPVKNAYYPNTYFKTAGIEVTAVYNDGSSAVLKPVGTEGADEKYMYELTLSDGTPVNDDLMITSSMVGTQKIMVKHAPSPIINTEKQVSFDVTVKDAVLDKIEVTTLPTKVIYYLGDEFDSAGMMISALYKDDDGKISRTVLTEKEFKLTGFDSSKVAANIVMTAEFSGKQASFNVSVDERKVKALSIKTYPRMTFGVGEDLDLTGLAVQKDYNNATYEDAVEGVDYTIDKSSYDSSKEGTVNVLVVPSNTVFPTVTLTMTIEPTKPAVWKASVFGASSTGSSASGPSSFVNTHDGNDPITNGTTAPADKVSVESWWGAGKVANSGHDGIAYYYTRLSTSKNFTLTGDVYVKGYLGVGNIGVDSNPKHHGPFNSDKNRNGQEAFGLMARDVVPLKDAEGGMTPAVNGIVNPINGAVAALPAQIGPDGEPVPYNRNGSDFSSNIIIAGGFSGSSFPSDTTAASYETKANVNRINLVGRTGTTAATTTIEDIMNGDAGGKFTDIKSVSSHFPKAAIRTLDPTDKTADDYWNQHDYDDGDRYRITLQKVNGGFYSKCIELDAEGKIIPDTERYTYLSTDEVLSIQDPENMYVGFFAARWAKIEVTNISLIQSNPATDPDVIVIEDEPKTPSISVVSNLYSTTADYNLILKSGNDGGGNVIIKQENNIIYDGYAVTKRTTTFPVNLKEGANNFTVLYTPSKADLLTSYEDKIYNFTVNFVADSIGEGGVIYAAPDGKATNNGSYDSPMNIDNAIGYIQPGDTIILKDGTYYHPDKFEITLANSGLSKERKALKAENAGKAIIDFGGQTGGAVITGSYWDIEGITFTNSGDQTYGMNLGGSNCTVKNCKFIKTNGTGMQISRTYNTDDFDLWPSYNYIENCEAYNNADSSKINADGFGVKLTVGVGNVMKGCVSHHNADDGWDFYTKLSSGAIGEVKLEDCISYRQGIELVNPETGEEKPYGSGGHNGYKMGGENVYVKHYLKDSYTFQNGSSDSGSGISSNSNPAIKMRNVVAFDNYQAGVSLTSSNKSKYNYDVKGIISYKNADADSIATVTADTNYTNASETPIENEYNYWDFDNTGAGVNTLGEVVTDDFFVSTNVNDAVHNGLIAQDSNGNFLMNGFLERTPEHAYTGGYDEPDDGNDTVIENVNDKISSELGGNAKLSKLDGVSGVVKVGLSLGRITILITVDASNGAISSVTNENQQTELVIKAGTKLDIPSAAVMTNNKPAKKIRLKLRGKLYQAPTTSSADALDAPAMLANSDVVKVTYPNGNVVTVAANSDGRFLFNDTMDSSESADLKVEFLTDVQLAEMSMEFTKDSSSNGGNQGGDDDGNSSSSSKSSGGGSSSKAAKVSEPATEETTRKVSRPSDNKPGSSYTFDDIAVRPWAVDSIEMLARAGIINGVGNGKFAPDAYSKRADFMVMIAKVLELDGKVDSNFDDVDPSKYYAQAVGLAKEAGIASGIGDNKFNPEATISRQDMMAIVARALEYKGIEVNGDVNALNKFTDAGQISDYAKESIAGLVQLGIVNGTGEKIEPHALITRAQMSVIMAKVYELVQEEEETTEETTEEATEETTSKSSGSSKEETTEATTVKSSSNDKEETTTEETTEAK